jgi:hypothetical protein
MVRRVDTWVTHIPTESVKNIFVVNIRNALIITNVSTILSLANERSNCRRFNFLMAMIHVETSCTADRWHAAAVASVLVMMSN